MKQPHRPCGSHVRYENDCETTLKLGSCMFPQVFFKETEYTEVKNIKKFSEEETIYAPVSMFPYYTETYRNPLNFHTEKLAYFLFFQKQFYYSLSIYITIPSNHGW